MNNRVLLVGILGAVAMFLWSFLAHMALPLGEAGITQISNERPVLDAMQTTMTAPGMYMFPNMAPGMKETDYQKLVENGPSGMMIYFPKREFNFGKSLGMEFGTELVQSLLAAYLLSLTAIATFSGRLTFYAVLGLCAVVTTNVSYWNWYGYPTSYTASYMFTIWMGFVCAGLAAGVLLRKKAS